MNIVILSGIIKMLFDTANCMFNEIHHIWKSSLAGLESDFQLLISAFLGQSALSSWEESNVSAHSMLFSGPHGFSCLELKVSAVPTCLQ